MEGVRQQVSFSIACCIRVRSKHVKLEAVEYIHNSMNLDLSPVVIRLQFSLLYLSLFPKNSYLSKGVVEKLEVVNKKWVRVRLQQNSNSGSGVLWFNIGSVDSFERNLEAAQTEQGTESINFVPVIYRNEVEAASLTGLLPTLLIIGFLVYMMRKSADMMGGGRGRKGGGLFGGVMQSTAKLTNPNEIGVGFK